MLYEHLILLTDCKSHDLQLVAHQFDHHALLQRGRSAAEHWPAAPCNSQELVLQTLIKGIGQSPSINYQAQRVHHEGRDVPGCGGGGIHVKGCKAAMVGFGSLICRAAEEFGLEIVQTLFQQQGTRLLVQRQPQRELECKTDSEFFYIICFASVFQMWFLNTVCPQITFIPWFHQNTL